MSVSSFFFFFFSIPLEISAHFVATLPDDSHCQWFIAHLAPEKKLSPLLFHTSSPLTQKLQLNEGQRPVVMQGVRRYTQYTHIFFSQHRNVALLVEGMINNGDSSTTPLVRGHQSKCLFSLQNCLRSADVRILQQLVAVHDGIEAMRWLMEERDTSTSHSSSLTSSLSSLVAVEGQGLSMSPFRYAATRFWVWLQVMFLCGVCMFSLSLWFFKACVWGDLGTLNCPDCVCECRLLFVFVSMWLCDELQLVQCVTLPSPYDSWKRLQKTVVTLRTGKSGYWK